MHLRAHPVKCTSRHVNPRTSDMSDMSERSTSVTLRFNRRRRPWGRALPLALAAALITLSASANAATPAGTATTTPATQVSLRQSAAREAARTPLARTTETRRSGQAPAASRASQTPAAKESHGFFKSRAGAFAIAVMAAGTGYALYSAQHDRIKSPGKE